MYKFLILFMLVGFSMGFSARMALESKAKADMGFSTIENALLRQARAQESLVNEIRRVCK